MSTTNNQTPNSSAKSLEELEDVIGKAIKKIRGTKENDLCKYIPISTGGYIHHFTLKKMKYKSPVELSSLIEKFIVNQNSPKVIPPKQRAARGSKKKKDNLLFSKLQLDRLLNMARMSGDKEMISLLSPKKSLAQCKRDLIQSIRNEVVDHELWNSYNEAVDSQQAIISAGAEYITDM